MSDFRYLNKCLVRRPCLVPKIADILRKLEGKHYVTSLDLDMGYYTVWLDPDLQILCSTITLWGKYQYLRLSMGMDVIFYQKMSSLIAGLGFTSTYLDDLLIISNSIFEDYLYQLRVVL